MYTKDFRLKGNRFDRDATASLYFPRTSAAYQEIYIKLLDWIHTHQGVAVFTGKGRSGKTTLLRQLLSTFETDNTVCCLFFSYPKLAFADLLHFMCEDLALEVKGEEIQHQLQALADLLEACSQQGKTIVLLLDEAQNLAEDVLAQIPLLIGSFSTHNPPPLQVILCGRHPELEEKLHHPRLAHLRQHISLQCRLESSASKAVLSLAKVPTGSAEREPEEWKKCMLHMFAMGRMQSRPWFFTRVGAKVSEVLYVWKIRLLLSLRSPGMLLRGAVLLALLWFVAPTSWWARTRQPQFQVSTVPHAERSAQPERPYFDPVERKPFVMAKHALPDAFPVLHAAHSSAVARGQALFDMLVRRYPKIYPFIWGLMTTQPAVALFLPEAEWAALSKEDQVSLTLYVESLIPIVRAYPDSYLEAFRDDPGYADFRAKVANLCSDCWVVGVGRFTLDGQGVFLDRIVVQGDTVWEWSKPRDRGLKASVFQPGHAIMVLEEQRNMAEQVAAASESAYLSTQPEEPVSTRPPATAAQITKSSTGEARTGRHETHKQNQQLAAITERKQEEESAEGSFEHAVPFTPYSTILMTSVQEQKPKRHEKIRPHPRRGAVARRGRTLVESAEKGDLPAVRQLLTAGVSPDEKLSGGLTALMMAAIQGQAEVVRLLIEHGANVHAKNNRGMTALMYAAWNRHTEIVQLLLEHGARLDAKDRNGWTALQYARDKRLRSSSKQNVTEIAALIREARARQ